MSSHNDDISPLFKLFGSDKSHYHEISREADADSAGERWPLLQNLPLQAREDFPALTDEQKQHRLGACDTALVKEIPLPKDSSRAGLASALKQLDVARHAEVARASATAQLVEKSVHVVPLMKRGHDEMPASIFNKAGHASEVDSSLSLSKLERPAAGFFSKKTDSVQRKQGPLGALFARLEEKERGRDTDKPWSAFLGRRNSR